MPPRGVVAPTETIAMIASRLQHHGFIKEDHAFTVCLGPRVARPWRLLPSPSDTSACILSCLWFIEEERRFLVSLGPRVARPRRMLRADA